MYLFFFLVNKFNKKPLELINEIANAGIKRFQIGTQRTGDSFFTTHCKIDNFGTFYGTSSTETGSREMVLSQLYETLANIANLFETVKLGISNTVFALYIISKTNTRIYFL